MDKINKDNFIKIIILFAFTIFFGKIIVTGEINNYVHPRIVPCVYFSVIGFILMIICEIKKISSALEVNFEVKKYMIFFIALVFIFYMECNTAGNFAVSSEKMPYKMSDMSNLNKNNDSADKTDNSKAESVNNDKSYTDSVNDILLQDLDGTIIINRENYVSSLDEILNNPLKYDGKNVEISGFIYRDDTLNEHEFVIGRYMMVCCAADLQIAGIKCVPDENCNMDLDDNTWIKIEGTISNVNDEAVINAVSINIDENPDKQYVYPF